MSQRILYCTDSLMAGGTEHQLVTLISRLDRQRFEPYVICLYGERAGRSFHFLEELRKLNVPVFLLNLQWKVWDKVYAVIALARLVRRVRPQVIQAVNYHSNLLLRLARPIMFCSVKLIGGVYVAYTPKQLLYEYISGWMCDVTVCNSVSLQGQLPRYLSAQVIFNGIDMERFSRNPDPTLRSRVSPQAKSVLLIIGRVARQKAPHLVVEALGVLKQRGQLPKGIAIWIVGESQDEDVQQQIDNTILQNHLENVILQFPANTPEAYYYAADIVVLPSLWEGLPNVILEALAAGKPLLVSEAANAAEVVKDGINGWVVRTNDVESLATKLLEVLPLDLRSMSSYCQASALPFSVMKMVQDYELLYERLTALS
ncbi:MAG: glycosyltransferase [Chloroflexota bacterium]